MTVALFLAEKTPLLVGSLLVAMIGLMIYPIIHFASRVWTRSLSFVVLLVFVAIIASQQQWRRKPDAVQAKETGNASRPIDGQAADRPVAPPRAPVLTNATEKRQQKTKPAQSQEQKNSGGNNNQQQQSNSGGVNIQQQSSGSHSPNQTMVNSPGGVQAGGDVIIAADRRLIHTMTLKVSVETETETSPPTEDETDAGLQSAVALFSEKTRIRFVSDWLIHRRQVTPTRKTISFIYTPETPTEIIGRDIDFLGKIDMLVVNYKDIFELEKFDTRHGYTSFEATVTVNGVAVAQITASSANGYLNNGPAQLNVARTFQMAPNVYAAAVSRQQ